VHLLNADDQRDSVAVRLTKKRLAFIHALASAKTYAEAYAEAYPKSATRPRKELETRARKLLKNPQVAEAYQNLLAEYQEKERKRVGCTREDLIAHLSYGIEKIRGEIERRENAIIDECTLLQKEAPSGLSEHEAKIEAARVRQRPLLTSALTGGIVSSVESLAKLLGYHSDADLAKQEPVVFQGEEEL
jgi:hypothetical protein